MTLKSTPRELAMMTRAERMQSTLARIFAPQDLRVEDQSARHHGHAGASPEGQTHFEVTIVAAAFAGVSRVERQRLVYAALAGEFETGLHALNIKALSPSEALSAASPSGR